MNYTIKLKKFLSLIIEEAKKNPDFEKSLINTFDGDAIKKKKIIRQKAAFDPIKKFEENKTELLEKLNDLNVEELKDIISEYGMDPQKLALKWKSKERLINHITDLSEKRSKKGNAFRKTKETPSPIEIASQINTEIGTTIERENYLYSTKARDDYNNEWRVLFKTTEEKVDEINKKFMNITLKKEIKNGGNLKIQYNRKYILLQYNISEDYKKGVACTFNDVGDIDRTPNYRYKTYVFTFDITEKKSLGWRNKNDFFTTNELSDFLLNELLKEGR